MLQANKKCLFSAVLKSPTGARGSNYLKQFLYEEVLAQRRKTTDFVSALQNAVAVLNKGFQSLHPFNLDVLQGVEIAVAFADFQSNILHLASNGGCRYLTTIHQFHLICIVQTLLHPT